MLRSILLFTCCLTLGSAADGVMVRLDFKPFYLEYDFGDSPEDKKAAESYATWISKTGSYFLDVFEMKKTCFEDYFNAYDPTNKNYDRLIRVRLFRKYNDFLTDYQTRYKSKAMAAALFGYNYQPVDEYGQPNGRKLNEVLTSIEGKTEAEVLRHLYHEMGHLFMHTYMIWPAEVPSWIQEGTAELFQFRPGNGTKPEAERDQRQGWLVEICTEGSAIPWPEFTAVRNLDNLDFTWKDPLRSRIQYAQAWSVMEFMLASLERRKAFKTLLESFKRSGEDCVREANQKRLNGKAASDFYEKYIYERQLALFKKAYGADLLSVEKIWRDWIQKNYDKEVIKKPILRYYRGDWWAGPRLNAARTPADRDTALATAEAIFNECVLVSPDLPEGYVGLGRVALARDDFKTAGENFAKATAMGSDSFEALLYGGMAMLRSGKAADAVAPLTKAVSQRPTHAHANFYLGQAMAISGGDLVETILYLTRARDLQKDLLGPCATLEGVAQYRANKPSEAAISFLRASNVDKNNPVLPLAMALAKAAVNETEDALAILAQAAKTGNSFAEPLAAIIKSGKSLPKLIFSRRGQLLVEGLMHVRGEEPSATEKPEEKPKEEAPGDLFGDPDAKDKKK